MATNAPIPEEMTRADYARYRGVRKSYITQLAHEGRLVFTADGKRVRVRESDQRIQASRDPSKEGVRERFAEQRSESLARELALEQPAGETRRPDEAASPAGAATSAPTPEPDSLMDVRRELITEQAASARLKRLELEGRLVDRAEVTRAVFEKARVARNALLALPDRLATPLAAETSPAKVYDLLVAEFRRIADELADGEAEATRQ